MKDVKNLKALAYDMIGHIQKLQEEIKAQVDALQSINQQIAEEEAKNIEPVTEQAQKET